MLMIKSFHNLFMDKSIQALNVGDLAGLGIQFATQGDKHGVVMTMPIEVITFPKNLLVDIIGKRRRVKTVSSGEAIGTSDTGLVGHHFPLFQKNT
jgi:hypothetical protein